jgi:DNA-damage-inducible protein J
MRWLAESHLLDVAQACYISGKELSMAANSVVRARIDGKIKDEATEVLASMGLSVSDSIRMLLTKIAREKAFPFDLVPNAETAETLRRSQRGEDVHEVKDLKALFKALDI